MLKDRTSLSGPGPSRRLQRFLPIALGLALASVVVGGHAETFDDSIAAPTPARGIALKAQAKAYFEEFDDHATARARLLMDDDEHAKYVDFMWQVGRAIDARDDLQGLTEYGLHSEGNGSYRVDLEQFPQWSPQYLRIQSIFSPGDRDRTVEALKQRGFRDSDFEALQRYLSQHSPETAITARTAPLTESFARRVKAGAAAGQRLDRAAMMAYRYQLQRATEEANRAWAAGLLDSLDRQRQRIIESYLSEFTSVAAIGPSDTKGDLERLESHLLSDDYAKAIEHQARRGRDWSEAWASSEGQ